MALRSIVAISQLHAMAELAAKAPAGSFVEVGVFNGGSAQVLYQVAEKQKRELHLFDTFTGTPFHINGLDYHKINREFAAEHAPAEISRELPNAFIHMGVYPKTHPEYLKDVAFVHCDCDQYESYVAVISHMWPIMVEDGIMIFDDYPYLLGAKRAVEEYFHSKDLYKCGQRYFVLKKSKFFPKYSTLTDFEKAYPLV